MAAKHKLGNYPTVSEVTEELKALANIGFPIFGAGVMDYLKNMTTVACMCSLGSAELAGGALAIGFTNITGYSVLSGLESRIEPLCSQAFSSNNSSLLNSIVRRSSVMLLLASVPIGLLWINVERVLILLNQDREIARMSGLYCMYAGASVFNPTGDDGISASVLPTKGIKSASVYPAERELTESP